MAATETPRYRNFSNNMPLSTNATPRAVSTSIYVEKEPERDPEEDCFMCRQAHVYVKPIGMQQERRVARYNPPPLTRAQIDELSRKKHLTKQEVKKLLQCYFPEIKDVKSFQLHKYHSCCYDPKHLNLCKNHITALQREREQHPDQHNHKNEDGNSESYYKDYEREKGQQNKVSFVRIKIEPHKGIPTRFLGPTALPESLADMLVKQVNRLEDKKKPLSFSSNSISQPYQIRKVDDPSGSDDYDDDDEEEDDDTHDDNDDDQPEHRKVKIVTEQKGKSTNGDLVVEDLDELNRLNSNRQDPTRSNNNHQTVLNPLKRKKIKKGAKKTTIHGHQKPKLKHWEIKALEQSRQEPCNCRHHVMRLAADQVVYDWCRCKDHQHKEIMERRYSITHSSPPPPPPPPPRQRSPPPPPPPRPRPKPRKVRRKSIGIDATEPNTTELALAYDPSAVDYDMIQEVIYYRTSSGRLIKPEITNAFTYDTMPQALNTMVIDPLERNPNKAEVLYMTPNGQLKPYEGGGQHRGKMNGYSTVGRSAFLSNPGSVYNGQAHIDTEYSTSNNRTTGTMPVLKLPQSVTSAGQHVNNNNNNNEYHPAEFTLATFSPDKSIGTPASRRSLTLGSQHSPSGSETRLRTVSKSMQKSSKPTYTNLDPTPDYGRESSIVANRRWFDQPLGDQNLRPVHDGQYGLIAGSSTGQHQFKSELAEKNSVERNMPKNEGNCTIS